MERASGNKKRQRSESSSHGDGGKEDDVMNSMRSVASRPDPPADPSAIAASTLHGPGAELRASLARRTEAGGIASPNIRLNDYRLWDSALSAGRGAGSNNEEYFQTALGLAQARPPHLELSTAGSANSSLLQAQMRMAQQQQQQQQLQQQEEQLWLLQQLQLQQQQQQHQQRLLQELSLLRGREGTRITGLALPNNPLLPNLQPNSANLLQVPLALSSPFGARQQPLAPPGVLGGQLQLQQQAFAQLSSSTTSPVTPRSLTAMAPPSAAAAALAATTSEAAAATSRPLDPPSAFVSTTATATAASAAASSRSSSTRTSLSASVPTSASVPAAATVPGQKSEPKLSGKDSIVMYIPSDEESLSSYQCLARKHIEIFEAQEADVRGGAQGRNRPIVLGQVGIRCKHCTSIPLKQRKRGSTYYPAKLSGVYQAAQNVTNIHLCVNCTRIPPEIREELLKLQSNKSSAGGGKNYWGDCAQILGVYEDEHGLRFRPQEEGEARPSPPQQPPVLPPSPSPSSAPASSSQEGQ